MFKARTAAPSTTDKNWIHTSKGGYNYCILINGNSVLPNCVGYAWGRWRELLGKKHKLSTYDAENWYTNTSDGYKRGSTPKLGAVICWRKGKAGVSSDGAGHVAIVEKINSDGSIVTSNSAYGGSRFYTQTLKKPYSIGSSYTFQGFIYLPISYDVTSTVERDKTKDQLQVETNDLRVRTSATTKEDNVIGYAKNKGIYNYYETKTSDGYTWYRIADNQWLAKVDDYVKIYPKEEPKNKEIEELENEINDLIAEIGRLDTELEAQKQVIEQQKVEIDKLTEELSNCQNSNDFVANLKEFVANETGTYYIKLEKGEKLYKN